MFRELGGEQARQLLNTEQTYAAYRSARFERELRFRGSVTWKQVKGRSYLYRKVNGRWKSLGPRDNRTVEIYEAFTRGRTAVKTKLDDLDQAIRSAAAVNKAMRLGRVPWTAARLLRRLDRDFLLGHGISVVGTHALFAYERMAGGHLANSELVTTDIDLLFDARQKLRLLAPETRSEGLRGILKKADQSFEPISAGSFRAVNSAGFMVDLIKPVPSARSARGEPSRIGDDAGDLTAAEIQGLAWLQNSPKIEVTVLDERGYPLQIVAPDPRAFALHKLWVAERGDRDPLKRRRDLGQARAVAAIVARYCPQLSFESHALAALPKQLRERVPDLLEAVHEMEFGDEAAAW
jgi:hypothetical protein